MYFTVRMYHLVTYPSEIKKTGNFKSDILRFGILAMCICFLIQKIFS